MIYIDQSNLSMNAGFYSTLPSNCYHQVVHSSFDLNIYYTHHINGEYAVIKRLIRKRLEKPLIQLIRRVFDKNDLNIQVKALKQNYFERFSKLPTK